MKKNILFIVLVSVVALGVIATVILASFLNTSDDPSQSDASRGSGDSYYSFFPSDQSLPSDSGSVSDSTGNSNNGDNLIGENIVNTARSILEHEPKIPFVEGGDSLDGFDNSGFIYYVLRQNGFVTCPRGIEGQTKMAARLEWGELKRGDPVFFYSGDDTDEVGFGGIFIGNGKMIACLMPDTFVQEVDISGTYYKEHFYCGVSLS